jgi:hypothetical protein
VVVVLLWWSSFSFPCNVITFFFYFLCHVFLLGSIFLLFFLILEPLPLPSIYFLCFRISRMLQPLQHDLGIFCQVNALVLVDLWTFNVTPKLTPLNPKRQGSKTCNIIFVKFIFCFSYYTYILNI